ncbi:triose-phosphate transporter family-domain-containing protein [Scheffersomyces xylosifermentans]|uniref:triose-phosphate transporter family-domain-containing protein n=1 Tax=Scheffersomyces xylosifermentans TaxID=1304137 RepID=UPI00315CA70F
MIHESSPSRSAHRRSVSQQAQLQARQSKTIEATIYISGWYFFSLSISIYNKWMFGTGLDFKFPILITSFHQFCLMVLSSLVLYFRPGLRPAISNNTINNNNINNNNSILNNNNASDKKDSSNVGFLEFLMSFRMDPSTYIQQIYPCSLASAGDIGLSNVSFKFISLSLYTMLKTSSLMFVLMFGLLFRLERFNWRLIVIVLVMTASVLMMVKKPESEVAEDDHSSVGIILVIGACMMSGLRWSFTQLLLKHNPYTNNSISTIFYISPSMCLTLFVMGLIFEGWSNFMASPVWEARGIIETSLLLVIPGFLAFMMTVCEFKLLTVAQVTTLSIAGIFKELLTIVLSSMIFGDKLSFINVLGLVFTFADILWYNYYRFFENTGPEGYTSVRSKYNDVEHNDSISIGDDTMELRKLQADSTKLKE